MISNSQIKIIKSLRQKKYRLQHNQFVAEGDKTIIELINASYKIVSLYSINSTIGSYENGVNKLTQVELSKISNLSNPKNSLGIFEIPETPKIDFDKLINYFTNKGIFNTI